MADIPSGYKVAIPSGYKVAEPKKPDNTEYIVNAVGEKVPAPSQASADMFQGMMKGFADVGESVTSGFGYYDNPVSESFQDAANWWDSKIDNPSAGVVGEAMADELTGTAVGGVAGEALGAIDTVGRQMLKNRNLSFLDDLLGRVNNALKTGGNADDYTASVSRVGISPENPMGELLGNVSVASKRGGSTLPKSKSLDAVNEYAKSVGSRLSGTPGSEAVERLVGKRIPLISDVADVAGPQIRKVTGAFSGKQAEKVRQDFIQDAIDKGLSVDDGIRSYIKFLDKNSMQDLLTKTGAGIGAGTALGALIGGNQ